MTILELAHKLNVSKTAIRKRLTSSFRSEHVKEIVGVIHIDETGCELISQSFRKSPETEQQVAGNAENRLPETPETDVSAELVNMLRAQLDAKDRQIEELNARLAETTSALNETARSLQAAQALHAGTIQQQIEAPKKPGLIRRIFHKS